MIKIKKSAKIFDVIYNEDANIKSRASLILLNDYYKYMDVDFINDKKNLFKYLKLRHKFLLKTKKKEWRFGLSLLWEKSFGNWFFKSRIIM